MKDEKLEELLMEFYESNLDFHQFGGEINKSLAERAMQDIFSHVNALVKKEREACAKLCEEEAKVIVTAASEDYCVGREMGATVCENRIRDRK